MVKKSAPLDPVGLDIFELLRKYGIKEIQDCAKIAANYANTQNSNMALTGKQVCTYILCLVCLHKHICLYGFIS